MNAMCRWRRRFVLAASAAFLLCWRQGAALAADLPSAAPDYLIDTWQSDDGLPQNSVISMAQTSDGYLWLSTFDGLARFDGRRFDVFSGDQIPALAGEFFTTLCADAEGNLWLRGEGGRLVMGRNGRFRRIGQEQGLSNNAAQAVRADAHGAIWASDKNGALLRWTGTRFVVAQATPPASDWRSLFNLEFGADGSVWTSRARGFARLSGGKWSMILGTGDSRRGVGPMRLLHDGSMALIAGTNCERLYRYANGRLIDWDVIPGGFDGYFMAEDPDGDLWISSRVGVLRREPNGRWSKLSKGMGLPTDTLRSEFLDREGNRWFGTDGGGLLRLKRRAVRAYGVAEGMSREVALSVAADEANGAWVAVLRGGLNHFDGSQFSQVTTTGLRADQLVWCVCPEQSGGMWFGTYTDGLFQWMPAEKRLTQYNSGSCPGLCPGRIQALFETRSGELWIGSDRGLSRYWRGQFSLLTTNAGLLDNNIACIAADGRGTTWVGTPSGLSKINGGKIKNFTMAEGLAGNSVRALYCDSEDTLWIGGRELTRLKEGRFSIVRASDGLMAEPIKTMVADDLGYLWLGTAHGILRASLRDLNAFCDGGAGPISFLLFNKSDGLPSDECSGYQPSAWKGPDGRLWFATLHGLAVIDSEHLPKNTVPPPVVIESVTVDDKPLPMPATGGVQVPAGMLRLEFHFAALSFTAPEKNRFRFRLQGYDADWSRPASSETATYTGLRPGTYEFEVSACNNDGVWNDAGAAATVMVAPFFWETTGFRICVVLATIGAVSWIFRVRLAQAERRRLAQEAFARQLIDTQETERKRIAQELHDGVGQSLLLAKNRLAFGMRQCEPASPVSEQLQQASGEISQALEEVRATARALRPVELDRLGLGKSLEAMLDRAGGSGLMRFSFDVDDLGGRAGREMDIQLYRIAQEAINNALKHSKARETIVELKLEDDQIRLTVQDDGVGFEPEAVQGEAGMGLSGLAERARLIGGILTVQSAVGRGCRLTIRAPLLKKP